MQDHSTRCSPSPLDAPIARKHRQPPRVSTILCRSTMAAASCTSTCSSEQNTVRPVTKSAPLDAQMCWSVHGARIIVAEAMHLAAGARPSNTGNRVRKRHVRQLLRCWRRGVLGGVSHPIKVPPLYRGKPGQAHKLIQLRSKVVEIASLCHGRLRMVWRATLSDVATGARACSRQAQYDGCMPGGRSGLQCL